MALSLSRNRLVHVRSEGIEVNCIDCSRPYGHWHPRPGCGRTNLSVASLDLISWSASEKPFPADSNHCPPALADPTPPTLLQSPTLKPRGKFLPLTISHLGDIAKRHCLQHHSLLIKPLRIQRNRLGRIQQNSRRSSTHHRRMSCMTRRASLLQDRLDIGHANRRRSSHRRNRRHPLRHGPCKRAKHQ